jgi:electron transport complex protein RnfG
MKLRDREDTVVLGAFLGAVALIAALVLALVSRWTAEPIAQAAEKNREKAFYTLLLPEFDSVGEAVDYDGATFYPVLKDSRTVGFVGQASGSGYGGDIELLTGFTPDGKITSVQVLRHRETPGLGANVCDRKFQRTIFNLFEKAPDLPANPTLDQFRTRSASAAGDWKISKDGGEFDYLTGATVTSRSITAMVNDLAVKFAKSGLMEKGGDK